MEVKYVMLFSLNGVGSVNFPPFPFPYQNVGERVVMRQVRRRSTVCMYVHVHTWGLFPGYVLYCTDLWYIINNRKDDEDKTKDVGGCVCIKALSSEW